MPTLKLLLRSYDKPPDDMDGPILLLFEEMASIWQKMESSEVNIVMTAKAFQHCWKRAKKKMSSLYSKL